MRWAQLTVTISHEASEAVANKLFDLDALGVEIQEAQPPSSQSATLVSYFPMDDLVGDRVQKVQRFLDQLPEWGFPSGGASVSLKALQDTDWSEEMALRVSASEDWQSHHYCSDLGRDCTRSVRGADSFRPRHGIWHRTTSDHALVNPPA